MNPALQRLRPIGLCLLAAVLVHSLVLALLQLQRQRLKPSAAQALNNAAAADDTPELLRFSRHQAEAATPAIVPLPSFDQLPPPPPPMAAAAPHSGASAKGTSKGDLNLPKASPGGRSGRAGANEPQANRRARSARRARGANGGGQPTALAVMESPAALLERLRRLASQPADARPGTDPGTAGSPSSRPEARRGGDTTGQSGEAEPLLRRPEGPAQQPYQALWESARPESAGPPGLGAMPAALERRSLSLAQARRAGGPPISHGEGVLLGDQLLLFWVQADQLWLLRTKLSGG